MAAKRIKDLSASSPAARAGDFLAVDHSSPDGTTKATVAEIFTAMGIASYAVASLPSAATANLFVFASNGRKSGEGAGAGTGIICRSDGTNWKTVDTGATVAA